MDHVFTSLGMSVVIICEASGTVFTWHVPKQKSVLLWSRAAAATFLSTDALLHPLSVM